MKTSVVSKEYLQLHQELIALQEKWKLNLNPACIQVVVKKADIEAGIPILSSALINVDITLFLQWIEEISTTLLNYNSSLLEQCQKTVELLDEETARSWIDAALTLNEIYFERFARHHGLESWLPQFLAQTSIKPYLQLLTDAVQCEVQYGKSGCGCPVCGEPVRLATLEGEGQKVLSCPRCLAQWQDKRLNCSHCGNDDHQKIKFLNIEGESTSQIQACEECRGYTKIIDTRQFISKPSPALLDLMTIHLDYVAQDQGFAPIIEEKVQAN